MNNVEKFYKKILSNLESKRTFIKDKEKNYKYTDIKKFLFFFEKKVVSSKENLKICTILGKSFFLYSSILSILISKNAWIPIDENLPKSLIKYLIKKSQIDIILIDNKINNKLKKFLSSLNIKIINIEKIQNNKIKTKFIIKNKSYKNDDLAMIFFTSGSTGKTKGVNINNLNFISSLEGQMKNIFNKIRHNRLKFGDYHNSSFVIILNILLPCILMKQEIVPAKKDIERFFPLEHIRKNKVNLIVTLPSTINRIKNLNDNFSKIKIIAMVMCGEPFYVDIFNYIKNKIQPNYIFNAYGSTELSPWVFSYRYKKKDLLDFQKKGILPIGKKFFNVKYMIKNNRLFINGPMVNKYIDKRENSYNHKIFKKILWYDTNDLVSKYKKNLFVTGRSDTVIKLRGYRIELRGIESQIRKFEKIKNCFVFLNKNKIVAAIETNKNNMKKLDIFMKNKLSEYMLPNHYIFFKRFPLNKSHKIDKQLIKEIFKNSKH